MVCSLAKSFVLIKNEYVLHIELIIKNTQQRGTNQIHLLWTRKIRGQVFMIDRFLSAFCLLHKKIIIKDYFLIYRKRY